MRVLIQKQVFNAKYQFDCSLSHNPSGMTRLCVHNKGHLNSTWDLLSTGFLHLYPTDCLLPSLPTDAPNLQWDCRFLTGLESGLS